MRIALATTGLIAVLISAGCGPAPDEKAQNLSTFGASESGASTDMNTQGASEPQTAQARDPLAPEPRTGPADAPPPPHIPVEAAPDVAFGYLYSFGLEADRIAAVQQRHARLCEELGAERCRVTGMNYRRKEGGDVTADLSLALEPSLAHRFGERALDGVHEAEGKLVDSKVSGRDVGSGIRASTRTIAQLEEQLAELEAQIARGGRAGTIRDLRFQAGELRQRIAALRSDRGAKRDELATTPMVLTYSSRGFGSASPDFGGAMGRAWDQVKWIAYGLFMILMVVLPWLLAAGLILLAVRALRRRGAGRNAPEAAPIA